MNEPENCIFIARAYPRYFFGKETGEVFFFPGVLFDLGYKKDLKRIKNLSIHIFFAFYRSDKNYRGEGKPKNPHP